MVGFEEPSPLGGRAICYHTDFNFCSFPYYTMLSLCMLSLMVLRGVWSAKCTRCCNIGCTQPLAHKKGWPHETRESRHRTCNRGKERCMVSISCKHQRIKRGPQDQDAVNNTPGTCCRGARGYRGMWRYPQPSLALLIISRG